MGQKANPIGLRLGITKSWISNWFSKERFTDYLYEDHLIRNYLRKRLEHGGISTAAIDRTAKRVTVSIYTSRPGIVIGKKGEEVERLKAELQHLTQKEIQINIKEVRKPEMDAQLVGDNIARQVEKRVSYKKAVKKAISTAMRMGAEGIKITVGGRLNGAEISRSETFKEGRIPLHTLRADIDYATCVATTTYGTVGIKVWICKGEVINRGPRGEKARENAQAR
ncbi:MAG: 30S ribosomal protein S3 [Chitinivibrionales bacterium]|nr:30S ribosomal protein S3 [Chitinivibrionales bacterium]MBD3396943.1 30S ribosomal protein S3 [Chitinivibrionales bacterium]